MTDIKKQSELDLGAIRKRLSESKGRKYWRSLEEIAQTEDFQEFLHREFRHQIPDYRGDEVGRRKFLQLMAASLALAGLNACTNQPREEIVPYVIPPERLIPGKPLFFASALIVRGMAQGVLAESHMGRPTKIEGNPDHPASLGAADPLMQGSILTLYDPDRAQVVTQNGRISTWESFTNALRLELGNLEQSGGEGFRILTETVTSPTLAAQIRDLLSRYPSAQWHQYEPASRDLVRQGLRQVLSQERDAVYSFDRADVVFSLDSDFLSSPPSGVRYTKDFSRKRRVTAGSTDMNRLYIVEGSVSVTGSMADHRLALKPSQIRQVAQALAGRLGVAGAAAPAVDFISQDWMAALARDLQNHRGSSIVIAGEGQPPEVHALVYRINEALGNVGRTVRYIEAVEANPVVQMESLQRLARDMDQGLVDTLVILSGNPVYTAPADLSFAQKMEKVRLRLHLSLFYDETSALCHWHIPETHYLETWSDARAFDGTASIIQPLIAPLYAGRSVHEFLASFTERAGASSYDLVRSYWESQNPAQDFERFWRKALHDGVVSGGGHPEGTR
ncbi:MAG: TAT-variant-translocated molybdopterin oxidoreductase, partial [Acidobacteriota bacterium]